jgi:hypothetical protein
MDHFRFHNTDLQNSLQRLYAASGIPHKTGSDGALICEDSFEATAESLRSAVRYQRFPGWHTCCIASDEPDAREDEDYRKAVLQHLAERAIPYEMEEHNGGQWLLLPEDEVLPDSIWESVYGPVSTLVPTNPRCCFCEQGIEGAAFGEISVRQPEGAFRSVLYSHLECLRGRVHPEALHIIDTLD